MRLAACVAACALLAAVSAHAQDRFAVVISGASGGGAFATHQQQWRADLVTALESTFMFDDGDVVVLAEESEGTSRATADNVRRLFSDLRKRIGAGDVLLVVLVGHGSVDGSEAKFNLVGPDLTARDWKALLAPIQGTVVLVNTTEASFPFLAELSQRGRVVITATDSGAQRFTTVFPDFFVKALGDPGTDLDKNGRVSVWEAFTAASAAVKRYYEERGLLSTEHPLLDDDGDRAGREAENPGRDGALARTIYLDPPPESLSRDVALAALERQRALLEAQIEQLKFRKGLMPEQQYNEQLENLLVQISRVAQRIRNRS